MNPYDQAHALAKSLKESEEYTEYMRLKQVAYDDSTNKALLDEYKRLQFRMQAKLASGENMPEEDLQRLQQIGALLQFNPDVCRTSSRSSPTWLASTWTCCRRDEHANAPGHVIMSTCAAAAPAPPQACP